MKAKKTVTAVHSKDVATIFVLTVAILMIPLIAMQFSSEVKWGLGDFVGMGILLSGTGLLIVLARKKIANPNYRILVIVVLVIALLLVWIEGAVGIFDSPIAGS